MTGCSFLEFASQELQATLCRLIAVSHLPLEIKIMIPKKTETVPLSVTEPGGTTTVTSLT